MIQETIEHRRDRLFSLLSEANETYQITCTFPFPLAQTYHLALDSSEPFIKTSYLIQFCELLVRYISFIFISQYFTKDFDIATTPEINSTITEHFPRAPLGKWIDLLFRFANVYRDRKELLLVPELHELFWSSSKNGAKKPIKNIRKYFDEIGSLRNRVKHGLVPPSDAQRLGLLEKAFAGTQELINRCCFLNRYDLFVLNTNDGRFNITRLMSSHPYTDVSKLQFGQISHLESNAQLLSESIYLSNDWKQFLCMYPLIIFWKGYIENLVEHKNPVDVGLYDKCTAVTLDYLTLFENYIRPTGSLLDKLLSSLKSGIIDKASEGFQRKMAHFTYPNLINCCHMISSNFIRQSSNLLEANVYLNREDIISQFKSFLQSECTCFVLIGNSGVGKTSFLLSLESNSGLSSNNIFLFYTGAGITDLEDNFYDKIKHDFEYFISLDLSAQQLFREMHQIMDAQGGKLIIIIDSINENSQADALFKNILEFIKTNPYAWLKIVLTSRPSSWRAIRHGAFLPPGLFFHPSGAEDEACELTPFSQVEVEQAYDKYRLAYAIDTPFSNLNSTIRVAIRDPLMLRFLAKIFEASSIPQWYEVNDIIPAYVEHLEKSGMLSRYASRHWASDIDFLNTELLPLFFQNGIPNNYITSHTVNCHVSKSGAPLFDLINDDGVIEDGRTINSAYRALLDCEILTEEKVSSYDYKIQFKYERFYDFFLGKYLYSIIPNSKQAFLLEFQRLSGEMKSRPYLWGPLKHLLENHVRERHPEVVLPLFKSTHSVIFDLLVESLSAIGSRSDDDRRIVEGMLLEIMSSFSSPKAPWRFRLVSRKKLKVRQLSDEDINAAKISLDVSRNLSISDVLKMGAENATPLIRSRAVRNIFHTTFFSPDVALHIIKEFVNRSGRFGLPDRFVLESTISLFLLIFGTSTKDSDLSRASFPLLKDLLKRAFHHNPRDNWISQFTKRYIRNLLLSYLCKVAIKEATDIQGEYQFNIPEIAHSLNMSKSHKMALRKLLQYLSNDGIDRISNDLSFIIDQSRTGSILHLQLIRRILLTLTKKDLESGLFLAEELSVNGGQYFRVISFIEISYRLHGMDIISDQTFYRFRALVRRALDVRGRINDMLYPNYFSTSAHAYIPLYLKKYGKDAVPDLFIEYFEAARIKKDTDLNIFLIKCCEKAAIAFSVVQPVLLLVRGPLDCLEAEPDNASLKRELIRLFSRLRCYYKDEVDAYLSDIRGGKEIFSESVRQTPTESLGDIFSIFVEKLLWKSFYDDPSFEIFCLEKAVEETDILKWIKSCATFVINRLTNEQIL